MKNLICGAGTEKTNAETVGRRQNEKGGPGVATKFCEAKLRSQGPWGITFSVLPSLGPAVSVFVFLDFKSLRFQKVVNKRIMY